jgi:hypothetical protein
MTDVPKPDDRRASPESLSRREVIAAAAAALAAPLLPIRAVAGPLPPSSAGAPQFLTPAEFALLDELTELVIPTDEHSPGAHAAGVAAFIDGRLAESLEPEWQALWRSGLEAVEGLAREHHQKPFLDGGRAGPQDSAGPFLPGAQAVDRARLLHLQDRHPPRPGVQGQRLPAGGLRRVRRDIAVMGAPPALLDKSRMGGIIWGVNVTLMGGERSP